MSRRSMDFPIPSLRAPGVAWARFAEKAPEVQPVMAQGRLQLQSLLLEPAPRLATQHLQTDPRGMDFPIPSLRAPGVAGLGS
eukprot:4504520-Alexandrium_andersonii.AAC.1